MRAISPAAMAGWMVWRDVTLAWRRRSDVLGTLFFFVMVVSLFPLSIGPETQLLRTMAHGASGLLPSSPRCCRSAGFLSRTTPTARLNRCC